ncbi:MAG: GntR family transcriptional regulator [Gemmatimonadetes bacterium]|jgi:GntR family transcriptional regulator|nr:GntR family transcriptional regulator [Gemmatimonadota bacterium]
MKILISNASSDPIYEQICKQIRAQILSGDLLEGDELPSIRALARDLQISVITTKRAYDELIKEGFVDSVGGKGCFVAMQNKSLLQEKKMKSIEDKLSDAVTDAKKLGIALGELRKMLNLLYEEE